MAANTHITDVRNLLNSFIYADDGENQKSDSVSGAQQAVQRFTKPRDENAFLRRVHSFTSINWFAKPAWLSPLVCARYGWENTGVDCLHCVSCRNYISGRLPSATDSIVYEDCCQRIASSLKSGHTLACPWASCPSPHHFLKIFYDDPNKAFCSFKERTAQLEGLGERLPIITEELLKSLDLTAKQLDRLVKFCPSDNNPEITKSAAVVSLTGWSRSSRTSNPMVSCDVCNRHVGLWNFLSLENPNLDEDVSEDQDQSESSNSNSLPFLPSNNVTQSDDEKKRTDTSLSGGKEENNKADDKREDKSKAESSNSGNDSVEVTDCESTATNVGHKNPLGSQKAESLNLGSTDNEKEEVPSPKLEDTDDIDGANMDVSLQPNSKDDKNDGASSVFRDNSSQAHDNSANGPKTHQVVDRLDGANFLSFAAGEEEDEQGHDSNSETCVSPMKRQVADAENDADTPRKKRQKVMQKIRRSELNPLVEHYAWCPWVSSSQIEHDSTTSPSPRKRSDTRDIPGWLYLFYLLLPEFDPSSQNSIRLKANKTSPEALRSIRKLFNEWTSPTVSR